MYFIGCERERERYGSIFDQQQFLELVIDYIYPPNDSAVRFMGVKKEYDLFEGQVDGSIHTLILMKHSLFGHWFVVIIDMGLKNGFIFDPSGMPPSFYLSSWMDRQVDEWFINERNLINNKRELSGALCLYFLENFNSNELTLKHFVREKIINRFKKPYSFLKEYMIKKYEFEDWSEWKKYRCRIREWYP